MVQGRNVGVSGYRLGKRIPLFGTGFPNVRYTKSGRELQPHQPAHDKATKYQELNKREELAFSVPNIGKNGIECQGKTAYYPNRPNGVIAGGGSQAVCGVPLAAPQRSLGGCLANGPKG
jgi:hypothetical protein